MVIMTELESELLRKGKDATKWSPAPERVIWALWSVVLRPKEAGVGLENSLGFRLQGSDCVST